MKCFKSMINAYNIDLSYNKFTKLIKTAFIKLKKLTNLNLSYNLLKKISPQLFAPAVSLIKLNVDKFTSYTNVKALLPSIIDLSLTVSNLNCTSIKVIADTLNAQNVYLMYNSVEIYQYSLPESFLCQTGVQEMNQLKKNIRGRW